MTDGTKARMVSKMEAKLIKVAAVVREPGGDLRHGAKIGAGRLLARSSGGGRRLQSPPRPGVLYPLVPHLHSRLLEEATCHPSR